MSTEEAKLLAQELSEDEEFLKTLWSAETPEEAVELLHSKGIDVTVDELREAEECYKRFEEGELSNEDLEKVSGGSLALTFLGALAAAVGSFAAGLGGIFLGEKIPRLFRN